MEFKFPFRKYVNLSQKKCNCQLFSISSQNELKNYRTKKKHLLRNSKEKPQVTEK